MFQVRRSFTFAMARWKLCAWTTFEILPLSTCRLCQQKSYISRRYSTDFRNIRLSSKMLRVEIWVESFRCAGILLLQWQRENFAHRQHLKFCHIQNVHCASKNPISPKVFTRFSKSLASARRCSGWIFGWKVSGAQVAYFCYGNVKTLRMNNIWNFATFNLYTVPEKIIYLQRYSQDFRNLCLSSKMFRVGIWVESFRCAGILLLQWQGENFSHRQHLKFCHVQPVQCASKNPMSPKVFTEFSKSLPQLEDVEGGHSCGKFQVRRYFTFAMTRWKLFASTTFQILPRSTCSRCQQKSYISKRIQPIFRNLCVSSKIFRVRIWVGSFRCTGIFLLQWQGQNFARRKHLKFCHVQPVPRNSKNPMSPNVLNQFSKSLAQLEDVEGGHFVGKIQQRRYFTFAMATWKLCASTTFQILPLSTCTLC